MLRDGDVIEGNYRIGESLSVTGRAEIYAVTHVRFEGLRLVMKVAAHDRAHDFERDTDALANLTSWSVAHVHDRGKLRDGRPFRVVERLAGPTLREALARARFDEERALALAVQLATLTHEAQAAGVGPCDLSIDNLVFRDGRDGRLCLLRAIVERGTAADPAADRVALGELRRQLGGGAEWRAPSSLAELRVAVAGKTTPIFDTSPGERVHRWRLGALLSESLRATVYEATPSTGPEGRRCVLKLAGPERDHGDFVRHARVLADVQSKHVVRVHDMGLHEGVPFYVMDALEAPLTLRARGEEPIPIDAALQATDELLWGALAIDGVNGAPSDFALEHCWQAKPTLSPAVLTHALAPLTTFRLHGRPQNAGNADAWSAAVALYELVAGRLPFPTSKHSLAKAWLGIPIPLLARRQDVPPAVSDIVHAVLTGMKISTADLRRELTRIRSVPATHRSSLPPPAERASLPPVAPSIVPLRPQTPVMAPGAASPGGWSLVPRASIAPSVPNTLVDVRAWRFVSAPARCPLGYVMTACFRESELAAVGSSAVARYRAGHWTVDPVRDVAIAALFPFGETGFLGTTTHGGLVRLEGPGGFRPWGPALDRFVFRAAAPAPGGDGVLLAGGTADGRAGVLARLHGESLTLLADHLEVPPIRALASLGPDTYLAACDRGTIALLRDGAVTERIQPCQANLLAAQAKGEPLVVGQGAWAFRVHLGPLRATTEAVDTTSSFGCLAHDGTAAWAGSDRGRILRRHEGHWRRMNDSLIAEAPVVALSAGEARVRALLADGQLILGQPA